MPCLSREGGNPEKSTNQALASTGAAARSAFPEKRFSSAPGFTLLELTLVLLVLGVLGLFASFAFSGAEDVRQRQQAQAEAEAARQALRAFLLSNKRLPCPDTDADGYEDCAATGETGTLPYHTLGLADAAHNRMFYGVYRDADIDITRLVERTDDAEGAPGYLGLGDAIAALRDIPEVLDTDHIYTAGIDADGVSDCDAGRNAAFLLIVPNADRDGTGGVLDGPNVAGDSCYASAHQPLARDYDDVVVAESPSALIGWLMRHMN
jgi:prepilin-type N-terminal cleavage/methylation domain-containing protein